MKIISKFCVILLFCELCSSAQTPTPKPESNAEQLLKLKADYDPQTDGSPLSLLDAPKDGIKYYETKLQASKLFGQKNYAEAEPLFEKLVRDYPRDPETWQYLAFTKNRLKKYSEAIAAHKQAGKLIGWDLEVWSSYYIAANYLQDGNKRGALDVLRKTILEEHGFQRASLFEGGYFASLFASLKDDPEFLEIIGRPDTKGWSRNKGWTYDLDFLYNEIKRINPDYRDKPLPAEFERRYKELRDKIPRLSDEEIFIGMGRMVAVLHQGHTGLIIIPNNRYLPFHFYAFPEGVFIIDAADEYKNLIGKQVISVGKIGVEEILTKFSQARSVDGDMQYLWDGLAVLASAYHLKGIGAINALDSAALVLQNSDGKRQNITITTQTERIARRLDKLVAPPNVKPPLFLSKIGREIEQEHWETALPEHNALYVQVNGLSSDKDETLPAFGKRLWTVIEKQNPKNLILDLRHNNGGTTQQYPELLRTLIAFSRNSGNQLYVLIGRRTYSATGNFITDLERLTSPIFVGEASSECCNLYGDPVLVILPYSVILGEFTAVKWQLSSPGDRRREMTPQVPVQLTADAYFKGQDPALESIYRLIAKREEEIKESKK